MNAHEIELDSGAWSWRVARLEGNASSYQAGERPAGQADPDPREDTQTVLLLEAPGDPENWMSRNLPRGVGGSDIDEDDVVRMARHPDRRQVVDGDGKVWRVEPVEKPEAVRETHDFERSAPKVRATSAGGPERIVSLPENRPLGAVSHDELLRAIGSHGEESRGVGAGPDPDRST